MECKERKPIGPCVFQAERVKQILECIAKLDKPKGNGKCMKARKVIDLDESGACTQDLGTTYLYPANTRKVGHESKV